MLHHPFFESYVVDAIDIYQVHNHQIITFPAKMETYQNKNPGKPSPIATSFTRTYLIYSYYTMKTYNCIVHVPTHTISYIHIWAFPKIGVPQMDGLEWQILLKWMIWGYHYFRKHPYSCMELFILIPGTEEHMARCRCHPHY